MHVSLESVIFFKYFCAEREGGRGGGKVSILQLKGDFKKNWIWIPKQKTKKMWLHFIIYLFTSPSWLILISMSILPVTEPNPPNSVKQNKKGT